MLAPRVCAGWPAIGAIALAVVLAHSGVLHLDAAPELAQHYRDVLGRDLSRPIGILQLFVAGGLCLRPSRVAAAAAFAAIVVVAIGNQLYSDRASASTLASVLLVAWAVAVAWGEARRALP